MAEPTETIPLPPGLKPLSHQVAGHFFGKGRWKFGFLECDDDTILKPVQSPPRGERELKFYQQVNEPSVTDPIVLKLREFIPSYLGTWQTDVHPGVTYFRLNDVTKCFKRPCILDVKVGPITYDPLADEDKIAKEKAKYPPVKKTGFQIIGTRMYRPAKKEYEVMERTYLRSLDENNILWNGIAEFLNWRLGQHRPVIEAFLVKLRIIRQWFETQRQFNFYASSLLLVYDAAYLEDADSKPAAALKADPLKSHQGLCEESVGISNGVTNCVAPVPDPPQAPAVSVHMIDFAHVFPSDQRDDNYLMGINGLITYLERLL